MKLKSNIFNNSILVIYLIIVLTTLFSALNWTTDHNYKVLGTKSVDLARLTANSLTITDQDFEELLSLDFNQLAEHPVSIQLNNLFINSEFDETIEYAYVITSLDDSQIRYTIDEESAEFFDLDIDTPLDYVWLLDSIVNDEIRAEAQSDPSYYDDIYRYTSIHGTQEELCHSQSAGYFMNTDEWGRQITGLVPLYTTEGTHIGMLGIDINANAYYDFLHLIYLFAILAFIIVTIVAFLIYYMYYKSLKKRMSSMVNKDKLTGLYTRNYYENYANFLIKNNNKTLESLSIILMDIDEFKRYNDHYGHVKGDYVLESVSKVILELSSQYESCPGRFGGEEFIVFLPNLTIDEGNRLCEDIRAGIERLEITHDNRRKTQEPFKNVVTISAGIVTTALNHQAIDLTSLIESADTALYQAKNQGRNQCVRFTSVAKNSTQK